MKHSSLRTVLFCVLASGMILVLFAFILRKPAAESITQESSPFPELLVRNAALTQTAEWQSNVHRVSALSSKLIETPGHPASLIELAQIYCIEARVTGEHGYYYPAVLEMLDKALSQKDLSEKDRFEATALKANTLLAQHRFAEGLETAKAAFAMNAYSAQVYAAMIDANVELGNYEEAVRLTDEMLEIKPGLMAYARASYLRELHGDIPGAIDAMEMAVEAGYPGYENTEWCRMHLAELYEQQGDVDKAEAQYRISMEYRAENPFAKAGLAALKIDKGEFAEAETMLKEALTAVPEISFQEELYRLYKESGREIEAKAAFDEVIAMVRDDEAHGHKVDLDYAIILLNLDGDMDTALTRVMKEYAYRPENIEVNATLARIYALQGKQELARQHLVKATRTGYSSDEIKGLRESLG